jgi:hypothetical protein
MDKNTSKPTPKHFTLVYVKYKCKERKKVTKHSSSQSLPAAAALFLLLPNKNSNQNQQRIPLEHVRES